MPTTTATKRPLALIATAAVKANGIPGKARQMERDAVLAALTNGLSLKDTQLSHYPDGAPYIIGIDRPVSISHCKNLAAVAIATEVDTVSSLGIDIETLDRGAQLQRIAPRFLSQQQAAAGWTADDFTLTRAWTIKEAIYKCARREGWALTDIPLPSPSLDKKNSIEIAIEIDGKYIMLMAGAAKTDNMIFIVTTLPWEGHMMSLAFSSLIPPAY